MNSKIKLNLESLKSRREWKRHKVKDGHNIFRVLPPFGESSNGYPYRKWQIIWGLVDPESGRARPFASSLTSEKRCPVYEFTENLKNQAETIESLMKASGASKEDISARLKDLRELIANLSPKTVYVYNAVDKSGEVGLLELKSTAHKAMKTQMNQYIQDYNQDPTSLNSADDDSGVWFDITRQGMGRDTEYDVKKCQTKVKTPQGISFVDDRSPLPDTVVENYDNLAYDLGSVYQVKTYEQLQEILDSNMALIVQAVPDADLSATVNATVTKASQPSVAQKPKTSVSLKLDDLDDDEAETPVVASKTSSRSARAPTVIDDDFMAEADAILNG